MASDHRLAEIIDESPSLRLPLALVIRLTEPPVSRPVSTAALLVAMLTRESGTDKAISEGAFFRHPKVQGAGAVEGMPVEDADWPAAALETAIGLGLVVRFIARAGGLETRWLMLNTDRNVDMIGRLVSGVDPAPEELWIDSVPPRIDFDRPTVFRLYEQNIGPLTPLIAQRLIKAGQEYPLDWIESAISEAVAYNRRSWRYIARILENRATEGAAGRSSRT